MLMYITMVEAVFFDKQLADLKLWLRLARTFDSSLAGALEP